jgi:hypothetical protein
MGKGIDCVHDKRNIYVTQILRIHLVHWLPSNKEVMIGTTSSGISYQLRDVYSIYRCCWNIVSTEGYILHAAGMLLYINEK